MWVARDEDGILCFYNTKPRKEETRWNSNYTAVVIDCKLFPDVKWEDEEPTEVDIIPKNNQREKHEESKSIDWEQRRYEIAKAAMIGELAAPVIDGIDPNPSAETIAMCAVRLADALIEELRKGE